MLDAKRERFRGIEHFVSSIFKKLPFGPNFYTLFAVLLAIVGFILAYQNRFAEALFLFSIAALLDFVDGSIARAKSIASKRGAYLDTVADRYVEALWIGSFLFLPMHAEPILKSLLVFFTALGSLMTTYAKAAAKEKELAKKELRGGLLSRAERIFFYIAIYATVFWLPEVTLTVLMVLCLASNFTALQRIVKALKL